MKTQVHICRQCKQELHRTERYAGKGWIHKECYRQYQRERFRKIKLKRMEDRDLLCDY